MTTKNTIKMAMMLFAFASLGVHASVASAKTVNCANKAGQVGYSVKQVRNKSGFYDFTVQARSNKGKTVTPVLHDGGFGGTHIYPSSVNGNWTKVISGQAWGPDAYFTCIGS